MSLTIKDLAEVEKSRPITSKNSGSYLEPSSLSPLEIHPLKYTHAQVKEPDKNLTTQTDNRYKGSLRKGGLLWHRKLGGTLNDGPESLLTLIPPASLDCHRPPLQGPTSLKVGLSSHYPTARGLSNYWAQTTLSFPQIPSHVWLESLTVIRREYKSDSLRIRLGLSLKLPMNLHSCFIKHQGQVN